MRTKTWVILFAVLLAVCAAAACFLQWESGGEQAEIWSDGKLLRTVDLSCDQTFTVTSEEGENTVVVQDGAIRVTEASCPDQICVKRGACQGGIPIVCLPNRLVIRFVGAGELDAAVG